MDTLVIIGAVLAILGIIGSIIPAMPGPLFSFSAIVLLFLAENSKVPLWALLVFGAVMIFLILVSYVAPILGAKYLGASRKGLLGAVIGAFLGLLFFAPLGIFIGAFFGAVAAEALSGKTGKEAMRAGLGVIFGSASVIVLEVLYSLFAAGYFFWKLF